jgi:quercetin dioxygenase-like cupin family protein
MKGNAILRLLCLVLMLVGFVASAGSVGAQTAPPGPQLTYQTRLSAVNVPGKFDLVQLVLDLAPGAATAEHTHGGQGLLTVLDGQIAFRQEGKPDQLLNTGESWVERPGEYGVAANVGSGTARVSAGFLLPKGATLTTVRPLAAPGAAPAGMPRTGADDSRHQVFLVLLIGLLLLALGSLAYLTLPSRR